MPTTKFNKLKRCIEHVSSQLNNLIWPSVHKVDSDSRAFFVFKPFPDSLKGIQLKKWAQLQRQTLSPFSHGDSFCFQSTQGVHLWFVADKLKGVPETAAQSAMEDGLHVVSGKNVSYSQRWKNGLLVECFPAHQQAKTSGNTISLAQDAPSWAVPRQLDIAVKTPWFWLLTLLFAFFCIIAWYTAGFSTALAQQVSSENKVQALQDSLGAQLNLQTRMRQQEQTISTLSSWKSEYGFLPESIGIIFQMLNHQGDWRTNSLSWQSKTLTLEISSSSLDIRRLVEDLETIDFIARSAIRPHNQEQTWQVEVIFK